MRTFWSLVVLLLLAAGAVVYVRSGEGESIKHDDPLMLRADREAQAGEPARAPSGAEQLPTANDQASQVDENPPAGDAEPASRAEQTEARQSDLAPAETSPPRPNETVASEPSTDRPDQSSAAPESQSNTALQRDDPQQPLAADQSSATPSPGDASQSAEDESPAVASRSADDVDPTPNEEQFVTTADAGRTLDELLGVQSDEEPVAQQTPSNASAPQKTTAAQSTGDATSQAVARSQNDEPKPAVRTRTDGAVEVGDRFTIRGKGTPSDPYQITWDLLVSANEVYRPRQGKKQLPAWANTLNGSVVEITGYVTYPTMADAIEELLLMRNQWDGCCIGIPPTPYDAVEVTLEQPKKTSRRGFSYGTVTGRLNVDPYVVNDWLIGLYTIEDASLNVGM